jgi:hypothetical protein
MAEREAVARVQQDESIRLATFASVGEGGNSSNLCRQSGMKSSHSARTVESRTLAPRALASSAVRLPLLARLANAMSLEMTLAMGRL